MKRQSYFFVFLSKIFYLFSSLFKLIQAQSLIFRLFRLYIFNKSSINIISPMSIDLKKRPPKEIHSNQNYLNFIKKNHLLIQEEFTGFLSPKIYNNEKSQSQGSGSFPIKRHAQNDNEFINKNANSKSIHDSLSKFQLGGNQLNQISEIYNIEKGNFIYDSLHNNVMREDSGQKSNEIVANLLSNKTKHAKHEAAKELLFHLNKNRSTQGKRVELKSIAVDRYSTILQTPDLNLKFPIIQKKNQVAQTIESHSDRKVQALDLRQCMKAFDKKEKNRNLEKDTESNYNNVQGEIHFQPKINLKDRTLQNKFKIRQELYGLLPVFRTPNAHNQAKKYKPLVHGKNRVRIQKDGNHPFKQLLQDYLEKNVILKSSPFSKYKKKEKQSNAVINRDFLDSTQLQNKEELDLLLTPRDVLQNQTYQEGNEAKINQGNECIQSSEYQNETKETQNKQSQIKVRTKKVVSELKYEGELSIYELKIRQYRQFIFMINLAHRIFDPILLKEAGVLKPQQKYKFYMGKGNNYLLVKSLIKRRFWWGQEQDPKKANFVWTQLKVNYFYQFQKKAEVTKKNHKLDKDYQVVESPKKKKKKNHPQTKLHQTKPGIYKAPLPANDLKIFTKSDKKYYDQFLQKAENPQKLLKFQNRLKYFDQSFFKQRIQDKNDQKVHNHLEFNYFIGNKKALFYNLKQFYDLQKKNVFQVIPLTFHIKKGTSDPQYEIFHRQFKKIAKEQKEQNKKNGQKNVWIVKPGQLSNRGQGITVIDEVYELNNILKKKEKHFNGTQKTYIVQKYIENPLLYKGRKFDIRHYMMISRLHGVMRAYWFGQGYIRTSSYEYNIDQVGDQIIHLTNDAIQKYCDSYGKYQEGNKVSYSQFQRYMDSTYGEGKFSFADMIYPKMKGTALDAVKATYLQLDPNNTEHNFEIFGLDFMIDVNYNVWLIEVNTNPCLQLSSKLLGRIIPTMLEQTLRLTLDVIFPPPTHYPNSQKYLAPDNPLQRLQFELIFDEDRDGKQVQQLFSNSKKLDMGQVDEEDQIYENDGKEIQLDNQLD